MKLSLFYLIILLLSVFVLAESIVPSVVRLGGLFPITGHPAGPERAAVFRLAVEQINNRTDLLPNTKIEYLSIDTRRADEGALLGTLEIAQWGNATGFIGSSSSGESKIAALVANVYRLPQISYASTEASLSSKIQYPYFLRTVPSDAAQGLAVVNLIHKLGWNKIGLLYSTTDYGASISQVVINSALARGISILGIATFFEGSSDLTEQMQTLKTTKARIFVVSCAGSDIPAVFLSAKSVGLIGDEYVWIGTDAVVQSTNFMQNTTTPLVDVRNAMKGMIGTRPITGSGQQFENFLDTWASLDPSEYPGSGQYGVYNIYSPYVYDSVLAFAHAYQYFIDQGLWPDDELTSSFTDRLHKYLVSNTSFIGLTGHVTFDGSGDRYGIYEIVNLQMDSSIQGATFARIGSWTATNQETVLEGNIIWHDGTSNRPADEPNLPPAENIPGEGDNTTIIIVVVVVGFVVVVAVSLNLGYLIWRRKKKSKKVLKAPNFQIVEFGEIKKTNLSKSQLVLLYSFEELILNYQIASILLDKIKDDKKDEMIKSVFYIYRANRKACDVITHFAEREIKKSNALDTLFREDNACTKLFRRYTRVVGLEYLWKILGHTLNELQTNMLEKENSSDGSGTTESSSGTLSDVDLNFEVDPTKISSKDDAKINKLNLLLLAQKVFHSISHSVHLFPKELRVTLQHIFRLFRRNFPNEKYYSYMGGFVYLRFICPAIVAPHLYGLYEKPPPSNVQRVLILLSKILQNLSNNLLFEGKEDFMTKLNDFIHSNIDENRQFIDSLLGNRIKEAPSKSGISLSSSKRSSAQLEIGSSSNYGMINIDDIEMDNMIPDNDENDDVIPDYAHHNSIESLRLIVSSRKDLIYSSLQSDLPDDLYKSTVHRFDILLSLELH